MNQPPPSALSDLVQTIEEVWRGIQERHPDTPDVVIMVAPSPKISKTGMVTGHWGSYHWSSPTDDGKRGEVLISAEGLDRPAAEIVGTILHEAAHAVATARGVKDTSREGRYHNEAFAAIAEELGLLVSRDPRGANGIGWALTSVPPETIHEYRAEINMVEASLAVGHRMLPARIVEEQVKAGVITEQDREERRAAKAKAQKARARTLLVCSCYPGRKIRVSPSIAGLGPIVCGLCDAPFIAEAEEAEEAEEDMDEQAA